MHDSLLPGFGSTEGSETTINTPIPHLKAKTILIMKKKNMDGKIVLAHVLQDVFDDDSMVKVHLLIQDVNNPYLFKQESEGEVAINMAETVNIDNVTSLDSGELTISESDFEELWKKVSDSGDTVTISEELQIEHECCLQNTVQKVQPYRTRSGRLAKYNKSNDYLYL